MKKKFLALAVASAMLMSATPAFAADHVVIAPSQQLLPKRKKCLPKSLRKKPLSLAL